MLQQFLRGNHGQYRRGRPSGVLGVTWDFAAITKPLAAAGFRRTGLGTLITEAGSVVYGDHNLAAGSGTQGITTVAGSHTVRFAGAGSIAATGAATATLTAGTTTLTCTAGTLTLTVTGAISDLRVCVGAVIAGDVATTTTAVYLPRYTYHPTTYASLGLLIEPPVTQLLNNGGLNGAMATQTVTVAAVAHTLHFTGTGTVTLSGVSTAGPLVGTGTGETNRVSLTFTPTAGALTMTVSGTCTNAQLEAGSVATSVIPQSTAGSLVRSGDGNWDITGADFTTLWGSGSERTIIVEWWDTGAGAVKEIVMFTEATAYNDSIAFFRNGSNTCILHIYVGAVNQASLSFAMQTGTLAAPARNKAAIAITPTGVRLSVNGAAEAAATSLMPNPNQVRIAGANLGFGDAQHILKSLSSRPTAITGAALQSLSAL